MFVSVGKDAFCLGDHDGPVLVALDCDLIEVADCVVFHNVD
jgi:hypothetical protein